MPHIVYSSRAHVVRGFSSKYDYPPALHTTWSSWSSMKRTAKKHGLRITSDMRSFDRFVELVGVRPEGTRLRLIDVAGIFEAKNVRWERYEQRTSSAATPFTSVLGGESGHSHAVEEDT